MDGKVDCGPGRSWGYSHSCARYLAPVGVAEFDEVVSEDDFHGFGECLCVIVVELFAGFLLEEVCDVGKGGFCTDVCVHGFVVGGGLIIVS